MGALDFNFSNINVEDSALSLTSTAIIQGNQIHYGLWNVQTLLEVDNIAEADYKKLDKLGKLNISKSYVLVDTDDYEHVDFDTFDPIHFSNYLPPNKLAKSPSEVYEKLKQQKVFSLYYLDKPERKKIKALHNKSNSFHISTGMANLLVNSRDQMLICMINDVMHLAIQKNGKFGGYEQHSSRDPKDLLYYILLHCTEHDVDPSTFPITLGGSIVKPSPLYDLLSNYLGGLKLYTSNKYTLGAAAGQGHYYLPFTMALACG